MKNTNLFAAAFAGVLLAGCSNPFSTSSEYTVKQADGNTTAVKDQTVSMINDQGIKIHYTLLGNLEKIEVYGVAPAWKGNVEILAEADAKERLVKYLYDEKVDTRRSVEVIAHTIDKARDDAMNNIENNFESSVVEFDREDVSEEVASAGSQAEQPSNTSRRVAERIENTKITALTKITSGGTLRGMRKVRSEVQNDGKLYVAVYEWSEKGQATANEIRNKMFGN